MSGMYPSCPVCSGKFSAQEVYDIGSTEMDDQLCQKHLREQVKMLKEARCCGLPQADARQDGVSE